MGNFKLNSSNPNHVIGLKAEPLDLVRIGFVGLGIRGKKAVERIKAIEGVEIVALADLVEDNVAEVATKLKEKDSHCQPHCYSGPHAEERLIDRSDIDLVYISTEWESHTNIAIKALKSGKHAAIEVPAAMTLEEIYALVETAEQTRKHCIQLENCIYDRFELTTLHMVQSGLLGDVIHAKGGYVHSLLYHWREHRNDWRLRYNIEHRGDLYPTHGFGPICLAMDIHRGDRLSYLVCMDSQPHITPHELEETYGESFGHYRNGDHTQTIIKTEKGKTIYLEHDVSSPRPYSRSFQLTGSKGFVQKYPEPVMAFLPEQLGGRYYAHPNHPNTLDYIPTEEMERLMEEYRHPIMTEEMLRAVEGLEGNLPMSVVMDRRLIHCLRHGLPLDMDVYDLAEWCCIIPLTAQSLDGGSVPVAIPDFVNRS